MTPTHHHNCASCIFLGTTTVEPQRTVDLYYCPEHDYGGGNVMPMLVIRLSRNNCHAVRLADRTIEAYRRAVVAGMLDIGVGMEEVVG